MARILIVEDEKKIARFLELELQHEGYEVQTAGDGRTGLSLALSWEPDLMILDLMLPGLSGIEVCRRLRHDSDLPIIMLTAKDDVSDKVMGLDMGADDYVTKPFATEELLARIRAALRKRPDRALSDARLSAGPLVMDVDRHQVAVNGQSVALTRKEFDLLHCLLEHKEKVLSRETLLEQVWGFDFVGETNTVDVYIRFLRSKLDERFHIKLIHTIRGVGYVIREELS